MDFKVSVFKYAEDTSAMGPQVWGNASFPTLLQLAPQLEKHHVQGEGTQVLKLSLTQVTP